MVAEAKQISSLLGKLKDAIDRHGADENKKQKIARALTLVAVAIDSDKGTSASLLRLANQSLGSAN